MIVDHNSIQKHSRYFQNQRNITDKNLFLIGSQLVAHN